MTITLPALFDFVPSMQDMAERVAQHSRVIEISTTLRTNEVVELRKALVRHTVDPIVIRCNVDAERRDVEPDLLNFVLRAKNLEGTYKTSRLASETVAFRVDRLMNVAMSPLLSFYDEPQDTSWYLTDVETELNLLIPQDSKLVIRTKPSTQKATKQFVGSPTMEFIGVIRS